MSRPDLLNPDELYPVSSFRVRIGSQEVGCRQVSGLCLRATGEAIREGSGAAGEGAAARLGRVTLRRALTRSRLLYDWAAADEREPRDVVVEQLDSQGESTGIVWILEAAIPVSWHGPDWDALVSAVAEESLELRYQRLKRL